MKAGSGLGAIVLIKILSLLVTNITVIYLLSTLQHSADSLGEDDLSEDLDRLKASLEAEREEVLNRSARLLPDER